MDKCCQVVLKNADYVFMGAPAVAAGATAVMFGTLEAKRNCVVRAIGYIGNRISVLTFALAGLPLLIYTLLKSFFLKTLNVVTFKKFACLNRAANRVDNALKIFLAGYGAGLMVLANIPALIAAGRSIKHISSELRVILDSIRKRDGGAAVGDRLRDLIEDIRNHQPPKEEPKPCRKRVRAHRQRVQPQPQRHVHFDVNIGRQQDHHHHGFPVVHAHQAPNNFGHSHGRHHGHHVGPHH